MKPSKMIEWDGISLGELLTLERVDGSSARSRLIDLNANARAYGGQTLGQVMAAAGAAVSSNRLPTTLQMIFLSGVKPDSPVEFHVTPLQDGKRFSSRHVRASQDGRWVADAHVAFAVPPSAPATLSHQQAITPIEADPLAGALLSEMPRKWQAALQRVSGYSLAEKPCLEFRVPDAERQIFGGTHHFEFWLRVRMNSNASACQRAAAFAYASDFWLNFSGAGGHLPELTDDSKLYGASLNHALWLYEDFDPTNWMLFVSESPRTYGGRALSIARVYDGNLSLVAVASQEGAMTPLHL